jgi:hypothetical protein
MNSMYCAAKSNAKHAFLIQELYETDIIQENLLNSLILSTHQRKQGKEQMKSESTIQTR